MHLLHLLPIVLPLLVTVQANPLPPSLHDEWISSLDETYNDDSEGIWKRDDSFQGSIDLRFFCDDPRTRLLKSAWAEAGQIARVFSDRDNFGHDYGRIMAAWLGPKWDSSGTENWLWPAPNYADRIHANIKRAAEVFGNRAPKDQRIHVACFAQQLSCERDQKAQVVDGPVNDAGQQITFIKICPLYFGVTKPMGQLLKEAPEDWQRKDMSYVKNSRGTSLFHEVMHMKYVGNGERIIDINRGYGLDAWCLARRFGTPWSIRNADSFAMAATAMYVQKRTGLDAPPELIPQQGASIEQECRDYPDPGPVPPADGTPPKQELRSPEEEEDTSLSPMCNGVTDTRWVTYDALSRVLPDFCAEADKQGVQDPGSAGIYRNYKFGDDEFQLGVDWPSGAPWKPTTDICLQYMKEIMNGCDGLEPEINPLNHKRGGYINFGVARFIIAPTRERYNSGTCSFHLHQKEVVVGVDQAGSAAEHKYTVDIDMYDGARRKMGSSGEQPAGDGKPYIYMGLHQLMEVTPEAHDGNYIQFTVGGQSWTTKQNSDTPRCEVGGWVFLEATKGTYISGGKAQQREMDCFFLC